MKKTVRCSGGFLDGVSSGNPKIYIANHTCSRDAAAVLYALNRVRPCLLVSEKRCAEDPFLRNISKKRVITAAGGVNTKWLHDALKRLKGGESLLIFPDCGSAAKKRSRPRDESRPQDKNDDFNSAFVLLSLLSGAEIVPLYSPPRQTVFHCLNIKAGKPMLPDSTVALTAEVLKKEGERVRSALSALAKA